VPCRDNVDADGRFRPVAELRERFTAAGATGDRDVISYCGSGVTACHNLIALEHAGLGRGRLYPGSWSQYSSDPDRPAAVGD
jgi:thiosulfate/3-mercaptopyruvate sulfurtransferase